MFEDTGIVIRETNINNEHPIQQDDVFVIDTDDDLQPVLLIPPGDEELNNNNNLVPINDEIKSHNSHGSAQQKYDP